MKYRLSTLTAFAALFVFACKTDLTPKQNSMVANSPIFQEMKKLEVEADAAMPDLVLYQKGIKTLLHELERGNHNSGRPMVDETSMAVRTCLSNLNKAENAIAGFKTNTKATLDTLKSAAATEVFLYNGKIDAEEARNLVLYSVTEAKKLIRQLRDKGLSLEQFPAQ
jgi:hypothetical protein